MSDRCGFITSTAPTVLIIWWVGSEWGLHLTTFSSTLFLPGSEWPVIALGGLKPPLFRIKSWNNTDHKDYICPVTPADESRMFTLNDPKSGVQVQQSRDLWRGSDGRWGAKQWEKLWGLKGGRWCWRDGVSKNPQPETTSWPAHVQINNRAVGSVERLQIRRQGAVAMVSLLHWSLFRIPAWAKTSKAASDRFIMSAGSALALNAGLKVHYRDKGGRFRSEEEERP